MNSMFERYGGFATVGKIVMSFYDKALDSDIVGDYFADTDVKTLIDHQTKFVAQVMGGPVNYTNEALRGIHARYGIDRRAFDEVVALLRETLEEFAVAPEDVRLVVADFESRAPFIINDADD